MNTLRNRDPRVSFNSSGGESVCVDNRCRLYLLVISGGKRHAYRFQTAFLLLLISEPLPAQSPGVAFNGAVRLALVNVPDEPLYRATLPISNPKSDSAMGEPIEMANGSKFFAF